MVGAFYRADTKNQRAMREWATWLCNECPSEAWGSREKVDTWMEVRRSVDAASAT
jgi:hypothetical protein